MLYLAIALCILAIILFRQAARQRKAAGLPAGRVIYTDTGTWGAVDQPFYDRELGLTGKPDYLVEQSGQIIPVEVKSRRPPEAPFDNHIFQLAAYCLLVQRLLGKRPPYGIIYYNDEAKAPRSFAIYYTPGLEDALYDLLEEMRHQESRKELHRSHESPEQCAQCGYRSVCDQRLK